MQIVYKKIMLRLVPFLVLLYIVAYLDRVNIGFAALSMNRDIGISDSQFGLAAGMFFIGYFICEVPSNLLMAKFGARAWISRIMISWGALSMCMAFVRSGFSYVALRFLLGAAEAGFFPGVIFYLTMWLPPSKRATVTSLFVFSIPLANVVGGPISASIMRLGPISGLHGWQWLFILEGIPAVVLGCLVPLFLSNGPCDAGWLSREEKHIIERALLAENSDNQSAERGSVIALLSPFLFANTFVYFVLMIGLYGLGFWLPRILQSMGSSSLSIGWDSAVPYGVGGLIAVGWAYHSDHTHELRWHLVISIVIASLGASIAGIIHSKLWVMGGFTLTSAGIFSAMPIFWSVTTGRSTRVGAATVIALINSFGNLGGFVGPSWMGWLGSKAHSFSAGLFSISLSLLAGAVAFWLISTRMMSSGVVAASAELETGK